MKVINLIHESRGNVNYTLTSFPDGEPHIVLSEINRKEDYKVVCRITNPNDLFVLMQVGDILNRQAVDWDLDIMYLMSARMDRVIHFEEAYTLKLVADIINSMHPRKVAIFHAHSKKTFDLINNSVDYEKEYNVKNYVCECSDSVYCFPDAGAAKRYKGEFELNKCDFIVLSKVRDLQNKGIIKSIDIIDSTVFHDSAVNEITIIDDLCDAGGTFILAAQTLRKQYPNAKLNIFVRHLVNPIGLDNLQKTFDKVYITDSYKDWYIDIESKGYNNVFCFNISETGLN